MKKRIISLLLALSMMISLVPVSALANTGGGIAPLAAGESVDAGHGLTINANGVPTTNGDGTHWTYSSSGYGTLTLKSGTYDFSGQSLKNGMTLNVETGATAQNFTLRVEYSSSSTDRTVILNNNGTIENAKIHGHANANAIFANNKGTIKNSEFANANVTNEQGATIEDSSFVRAGDSRSLLTNLGTVENCAFFGAHFFGDTYGTITNCVAWGANEFPEGVQAAEITIDGDARWTITDPRMPDRLATDKFYIVGSPTLKIQIWDTVKRTNVPLSDINGATSGIKEVTEDGETWYKFTPDSSKADSFVLNVRKEHQLTVTGGGVIKEINGTDTTGSPTTAQVKETLKVTLEAPEPDGKAFKEWKVTAGTAPTNFVYKRNEYYNLIDNPTSFYMPEGDVTLEATYYNEALEIGEDGKPVTEGRKPYGADGKGVQGDGWTYDGTTLKLNPTEAKTFDLTNSKLHFLDCELEVGENATVAGRAFLCRPVTNNGTINGPNFHKESYEYPPKLTNNGTVENCYIDYGSVTNNGTMENVSFLMCTSLTNNADATIKNAVVRTDGRNMAYNNSGTIKNAVFEFKPSGETVHVLKTEEDGKNPSASVEGCSYGVSASQVYIIGEPVLKARIYDTVNRTYVTITNVNGNTSYGGLTADTDQNNYQKFTVQSGDTELVLNQGTTVTKYTLTLTNATANPDKTEYNDGDEITLTAKDAAEGKEFDKWELDGLMLVDGCQKTNATIKVTITGNATATATYKDKTYKLTLETDGTENAGIFYRHNGYLIDNDRASLAKDDTAELEADVPEGKQFDKWELSEGLTLVDGSKLTDATIKIKMPGKEATAKAFFKDKTPTTYTLTLTDATANPAKTKYNDGDEITLTAKDAAEGKEFDKWELDGLTLKDGYQETNATIEVTITGNATAKATYKDKAPTTYTLTLTDATADPAQEQYTEDQIIMLTAKDAAEGKEFDKWILNDGLELYGEGKLTDEVIWVKITGNATARATYKDKTVTPTPNPDAQPTTYTITTDIYGEVNGGASATVKENDWVHMTVAEVPEGMTFDYWDIPDALLKALQKQNSGFRNNVENLNFQMPNMGEEEQTFAIKANFRSSELPGEDDGPSTLGTMATVAVGGAAAGILVWQGVSLGVDSYLQLNLPQGVAVPTNRRELVKLLWETAGKPETALPSLYSDVPAEEIELQKATRWAIDNGLVKPADDNDASRFDPDRYVTKYDVFGAWLKLKKLMKL